MHHVNLYIFNETSRASVYGIGTYLGELAALQNDNISITVVHFRVNEPVIRMEKTNGVEHWYIPGQAEHPNCLDYDERATQYYRNVLFLLRLYIRDTGNLVFHLNYIHSKSLAEILKEAFECRVVFAVHYLDWCFALSGNVVRFREILATRETDTNDILKKTIYDSYLKEKTLFETVDHVICLSENTRQILCDDYQLKPDKTTVIYNGLTDCKPGPDKAELHRKYRIPDAPVILFTGRLNDIKGLTYALQALKIVINILPHCQMIITGNGNFNAYLNECVDIWTNVIWTGLIDKEKLYDFYSIADIGVMPSLHEQCSYVAIEMMMHGIPLIASTSTGLSEMVEDGITGLHIPVIEHPDRVDMDTELLAEKILYLLQHPSERKRMGASARERYEHLYSLEMMRNKMLNFYTSLYDTENNSPVMGRTKESSV